MPFYGPKPSLLRPDKKNSVGILGCGWLGLAVGKHLLELGFLVRGSTRNSSSFGPLQAAGIAPFQLELHPEGTRGDLHGFLDGVSVLLIAVPPGIRRNPAKRFDLSIQKLAQELSGSHLRRLYFVSSTSVFGKTDLISQTKEVDEDSVPFPSSASGNQLLAAEKTLLNLEGIHCTVLRPGGLIGENRHPIHQLSGRTGLGGGSHPVNLIQQHECARIIGLALINDWAENIIHLVYPNTYNKEEYYSLEAQKRGLALPGYATENDGFGVRVLPKVLLEKNYDFIYPIES